MLTQLGAPKRTEQPVQASRNVHPVHATDSLFNKIRLNRKTQGYSAALMISRLILLNYHPDVQQGQNHVLAIMFDMNTLWERFIYQSLLRYKSDDDEISAQTIKSFWQPSEGPETTIIPDILVVKNKTRAVLDTKWKDLNDANPSADDLRQLYVYHHYYNADKVALIYPGSFSKQDGIYYDDSGNLSSQECAVLFISPSDDVDQWQQNISDAISLWMNPKIIGKTAP